MLAHLHTRPDYVEADITTRRLAREEHIETTTYTVKPGHQFADCEWCETVDPNPAMLTWAWDRHDATTDGYTDSCADWACVRAVLDLAEQDSDPEGITVECPIVADDQPVMVAAA